MSGVRGEFPRLDALREQLRAAPQLYEEMKHDLGASAVSLTQETFEEQRDPFGATWKPSQRAVKQAGQTLRDSGRLRNSLNSQALAITRTGFVVGTNVEYAAIHNFGGLNKRSPQSLTLHFDKRGRFHGRRSKGKRVRTIERTTRAYTIQIPKRQFLPDAGPLPPAWAAEFQERASVLFRRHFDRR